jgi:hypothetical protein
VPQAAQLRHNAAMNGDASMNLMRFPAASRRDPAIDAWFATRNAELAALARYWFNRMREAGPDMRELMHDGCPTACVGDIALGYVNVFTSHVNVGFFLGAQLDDPAGLLLGNGRRMRHVKLRPGHAVDDIALGNLIDDAYAGIRQV